ncbi:hypothetical protein D3C72_2115570 [compost metagenome]
MRSVVTVATGPYPPALYEPEPPATTFVQFSCTEGGKAWGATDFDPSFLNFEVFQNQGVARPACFERLASVFNAYQFSLNVNLSLEGRISAAFFSFAPHFTRIYLGCRWC